MAEVTEADRETLRRYIADRAPIWEVEFDAGAGMVVSLADAAHVATQFIAEEREKARAPFLRVYVELQSRVSGYDRTPATTLSGAREEAYVTCVQMLGRAAEETP